VTDAQGSRGNGARLPFPVTVRSSHDGKAGIKNRSPDLPDHDERNEGLAANAPYFAPMPRPPVRETFRGSLAFRPIIFYSRGAGLNGNTG